ncbi:hypothetical protein OESDEN_19552, partial [Oesophagostomum dentatum]
TSEQPSPQPPKEEEVVENEEDDEDDDSSSGWVTDHGSEDEEDLDFDENEALSITSCLFCPQTKPTKEESLEHMRFHHGFVLPDKKYLVDEDGMLKYLGLKVGAGRCCIFCPDIRSRFATTAACQAHMRDKQHCKVNRDPEGMLEFAEYYDYRYFFFERRFPSFFKTYILNFQASFELLKDFAIFKTSELFICY